MAMLMGLMIIVVMSCKKKDDTAEPSSDIPKREFPTDIFKSSPLKMMSDYEISNNFKFPAWQHRKFGKAMVGEEDDPIVPDCIKAVAENLSKIMDYKEKQHKFQEINDQFNELDQQLTILSGHINNMNSVLGIATSQIANLIETTTLNTQVQNVNSSWGAGAATNGFMWYSEVAANWEQDSTNATNIAQMNNAAANVMHFAEIIYNDATHPGGMINVINAMNEAICPSVITPDSVNALYWCANLIVQEVTAKNQITTEAEAMAAYCGLEAYFLQVLNYQAKAAVMYTNACNVLDSTGILGYAKVFWDDTYVPAIKEEVRVFLQAADFLALNLNDYRSHDRFAREMDYFNCGLAPDLIWRNSLGRAQFVANEIYDGLGLDYPVMCGTITTPKNYNINQAINQITLAFNVARPTTVTLTANTKGSQIPYTFWTEGNPATINSDNQWNVYKMGTMGQPDPSWTSGSLTINGTGFDYPWKHTSPITGNVNVYWFNPMNPLDSTVTRTSTNTMQFAYFSANWGWGYFYCSDYSQPNVFSGINYWNQLFNTKENFPFETPFTYTTNGTGNGFGHAGMFTYPSNALGLMELGGNLVETSHYYMAADLLYCNVKAVADPPTLKNSDLQAWVCATSAYGMAGSGGSDLWISAGLGLTVTDEDNPKTYCSDADLINNVHYNNTVNSWHSDYGYQAGLQRGTEYQPNTSYAYQTYNCGSPGASIQLYTSLQFIYTGYYNLPTNP